MTREVARALVDAGYMTLAEYFKRFPPLRLVKR